MHFGNLSLPYFPLEGMFTRTANMIDTDGKFKPSIFIETSTPGIPGQSGGPTFDRYGRVWAIQSQTITIDLGLNGIKVRGRQTVEVPQFVSLGLGTHVDEIRAVLDAGGVKYATAVISD